MERTTTDYELSQEPFLGKITKVTITDVGHRTGWRQRSRLGFKTSIAFHAFLIIVYTIASLVFVRSSTICRDQPPHSFIRSPARDAIEYQEKTFNLSFTTSPFTGIPRPELDRAWHELLRPINLRVSEEDLELINLTSVDVPGGHLAQLGVFHELHCIKIVRQWLRRDYYHPNLSPDEEAFWTDHTEHCLELFRESAMCRGDVSLTTFVWGEDDPRPLARFLSSHDCVNWDKLVDWSKERYLDGAEMGQLQNPLQG